MILCAYLEVVTHSPKWKKQSPAGHLSHEYPVLSTSLSTGFVGIEFLLITA